MKKKLLMTLVLSTFWCVATRAQMIAANIDALWAVMMSPSIGLEMVVGERSTIGLNRTAGTQTLRQEHQVAGVAAGIQILLLRTSDVS